MSDRAKRLGLEPGSIPERMENLQVEATEREVNHSIAISLMGLRIAAERIADLEERMLALHEQQARDMAEIKSRSQL